MVLVCASHLCITLAVFTGFLHLSCAGLLNTPVLPVTCDIICAGGEVVYHGFVFVFKQPLAALYSLPSYIHR